MIDIDSYIKEGIIFSLNNLDCERLIKDTSLFKEVTEEAQDFYIAQAVKENAIIGQFADEMKGIKKPFEYYLEKDIEIAKGQKIYVVLDQKTTLHEFYEEIQKHSYEHNGFEMYIRPMFLWCKGVQIPFDLLDDVGAIHASN